MLPVSLLTGVNQRGIAMRKEYTWYGFSIRWVELLNAKSLTLGCRIRAHSPLTAGRTVQMPITGLRLKPKSGKVLMKIQSKQQLADGRIVLILTRNTRSQCRRANTGRETLHQCINETRRKLMCLQLEINFEWRLESLCLTSNSTSSLTGKPCLCSTFFLVQFGFFNVEMNKLYSLAFTKVAEPLHGPNLRPSKKWGAL